MQLTRTCYTSALAVAMSFAVLPASAQFSFTKIVDTNTPIPAGTGNFTGFHIFPSLDGGDVAFTGFGASSQEGVYTKIGGALNVVADKTTAIPGGTGNFTLFDNRPSINNGKVAFLAFGASGQQGFYTNLGGTLGVVADTNTAFPGGTGNFTTFVGSASWLEAGNVAFRGDGNSGQAGIFTGTPGSLNVAVDTSTAIPGGTGNFTGFGTAGSSTPTFDGTGAAFKGFGASGQAGVYTSTGGGAALVADKNTAIPGGTGNFTAFGNGAIDAGDVAFRGFGSSGQDGIYTDIGGLSVVADVNTLIPDGTGTFTGLGLPNLDGGNVAFFGLAPGQQGIYTDFGGSLTKVVDLNDILDGKGIVNLILALNALSGNQLAFYVEFADSSQGVYVATIPEPATMSLFALGAVALARKRRRRTSSL